jgi:gluconokinase
VPRVLALDIGTSSVRATIYTERLRPLRPGVRNSYTWRVGSDGSVELPAPRLERLVSTAIDGALAASPGTIDAVATAAYWHSLVGVARDGRPVTPVLPWSDTRAGAEATALRGVLDERAIHARTGCRLHPTYWPARLRWFKAHDARSFARVDRWMSFPGWLERRWLGRDAESISQASGTGLFVHRTCGWDADLVRACGANPEQFPRIVDLDDRVARLRSDLARRWPALKNAVWVPAAGDGALNNLGAGCADGSRAALMIGTSGALRLVWDTTDAPAVPCGLWRYWLDRRRVVVGGALSNGGNLVAWMRDTFGVEVDRRLDARLARFAPDSHGLTLLPFLAGERSPDYRPDARAAIAGLHLATTRDDIVRAALEAVALRFLAVLDALVHIRPVARLVATGTALTSSPVWLQILADALGRPIALAGVPELTSRGAAIAGFERLNVPTGDHPLQVVRGVVPDRRAHDRYRAAAARQQALAGSLSGKFL